MSKWIFQKISGDQQGVSHLLKVELQCRYMCTSKYVLTSLKYEVHFTTYRPGFMSENVRALQGQVPELILHTDRVDCHG